MGSIHSGAIVAPSPTLAPAVPAPYVPPIPVVVPAKSLDDYTREFLQASGQPRVDVDALVAAADYAGLAAAGAWSAVAKLTEGFLSKPFEYPHLRAKEAVSVGPGCIAITITAACSLGN